MMVKVNGYRGIWYELGKGYEYGDKYSGGLGTYTANHTPMAVYARAVQKTFFVYGGTSQAEDRYLLCMVGTYDHRLNLVCAPTVVCDKGINGVNDPHDNPAIALDCQGYLWIFVAGRNDTRDGCVYRSTSAYCTDAFEKVQNWSGMTYPQPWAGSHGFSFFYTRYTAGRELYFSSSADGIQWGQEKKIAGFGGHYQVSAYHKRSGKIGTFFNYHPGGDVDKRTNLYYLQSADGGQTWTTANGKDAIQLPLETVQNSALVIDLQSQGQFMYTCDLNWDAAGNPVMLYVVSADAQPGPGSGVREWRVTHWDGAQWRSSVIAQASHNYDMGSLYVEGSKWLAFIPSGKGPQPWGAGGEVELWGSDDEGLTWSCLRSVTANSSFNHSYVRRPVDATDSFYAFWADGNAHAQSPSHLYCCTRDGGSVLQLPYAMSADWEPPVAVLTVPPVGATVLPATI